MHQFFVSLVATDAVFLALAEFNGTHGGKVLCVLRNFNQILWLCPIGNCDLAFLPHAGNIRLPGFAHATNETVRTAQEKDMRTQSVAASKDTQILQNDGLEQ